MSYGFKVDLYPEEREALREALNDMRSPVRAFVFISDNCNYCGATVKLMETIREESPEVNGVKLFDFKVFEKGIDDDVIDKYRVTRFPSVYLLDGAIRYYGIPAGEEIRGFVETIIRISQGESGLDPRTVEGLKKVNGVATIETIVTPSCPYCPYAALMANMFAYEAFRNKVNNVVSIVVEAYENMDIAEKYAVSSVPTVVVNERVEFIGVPYEDQLLESIIKRAKPQEKRSEDEKFKKMIKDILKELEDK